VRGGVSKIVRAQAEACATKGEDKFPKARTNSSGEDAALKGGATWN